MVTFRPPRPRECTVTNDADAASLHTGGSRPRALVVESDHVTAEFLRGQLEELGFATETVSTGVQAVIAARRAVPSLILAALQLQDVRGSQLMTWLRSNPELKNVPVVAIHAANEDGSTATQAGFAALLKKPVTAAKIRQAVTVALPVSPCLP